MLLSDRDILAAQAEGHISLDPWTPEMVQPASIDVRLDRFFRLFNNHAYTYVDPAENQGELTEQFEVKADEPQNCNLIMRSAINANVRLNTKPSALSDINAS